jgi:hypothetical protein
MPSKLPSAKSRVTLNDVQTLCVQKKVVLEQKLTELEAYSNSNEYPTVLKVLNDGKDLVTQILSMVLVSESFIDVF